MKTLFDLRNHSSLDLDRLAIGIQSGINDAKKLNLEELADTLTSFKNLAEEAKRQAIERESKECVDNQTRDILGSIEG